MDGTLVDSEPVHRFSFEQALGELNIEPPCNLAEMTVGKSERVNYDCLNTALNITVSYEEWIELRFRHFLDNIEMVHLKQESIDVWKHFERNGVKQAIVTNADRIVLDANLTITGLIKPGLITVTRNDVCEGKPSPEPYLRAAHLLNVSVSTVAVVEDSLLGAEAGISAGMDTYLVSDDNTETMAAGTMPFELLLGY